ncbi:MAG: tryptophan-rich sensory protein [Ruminococcaceae bacterium]|nr:tryptophan-rich sensory protein [Oscillospiraceae bacterium]
MKSETKSNILKIILFILIPIIPGFLISVPIKIPEKYALLLRPPLAPPSIVFPIVWSILYILMGIGSFLAYKEAKKRNADILSIAVPYGVQLILNLLWTPVFFGISAFLAGSVICVLLVFAIIWMILAFYRLSPVAAYLQIPYLLWSIFASYLSIAIYILN